MLAGLFRPVPDSVRSDHRLHSTARCRWLGTDRARWAYRYCRSSARRQDRFIIDAKPCPTEQRPGPLLALGITQITAWGSIYYLFPLVMEPLQAALGASKAVVVGAFSGALLVSGLLAQTVWSAPASSAWWAHLDGRCLAAGALSWPLCRR
jgi:hypothetical protein